MGEIRKAKADSKVVAGSREDRRETKKIEDYVVSLDPETAKAQELKQKHAEQEKWDSKKAKWERKAAAAAAETDEVDLEADDADVN